MLHSPQVRLEPRALEQSFVREPTIADQDSRFVFYLSGLLDLTLAGVIGFLGLEFVDGEATLDRNHMITAALLVVMGVATLWCGLGRAPKGEDEDEDEAASIFKG